MEVAGQWRRQWAGTAEYGKVTEGGVTRRVARAMEVLHASAPGARVRVLRAAYHSTAGPGAPAASYLMHSSRRVISSGYNFTELPPSPSKPLEISSTPLESSPDLDTENENYKVTEPDDLDISEPSKWKGSKSVNDIRMPSEESSSTDNGSIIDLDYNNKNNIKKQSDYATKFIPQTHHKNISPIYSLLDSPVTLSTLKYTSLLNGNDSWNSRRKSYSFEETPEFDEPVLKESDAVNIESSTDSGICKSSEIVNSENFNLENLRYVERKVRMDDIHEETFKDWLSKDRQKPFKNQFPIKKENIVEVDGNDTNYITLQSAGKVSITLSNQSPTPPKENNIYEVKKSHLHDDYDKKTKKVEFCKTELHFAAESGTVNIIATDEKPPPSYDFRKKRSIFVPISNNYNKSITLFGDKTEAFEDENDTSNLFNSTIDENTAATKSILKNKIPKPKPYLLGENMVFGNSIDHHSGSEKNEINNRLLKPTGVSLINTQITPEKKFNNDLQLSGTDWSSINKYSTRTTRTTKTGPVPYSSANLEIDERLSSNIQSEKDFNNVIKSKLKILQISPSSPRPKTRQLRESDLTYFGVAKKSESQSDRRKHSLDSIYDENNLRGEILHSVQLVKSVSNSVCNSEIDSDEAPDYENIQMKYNFASKPVLRSRLKHQNYLDSNLEHSDLNPILEREDDTIIVESRRPKTKKHVVTPTSRSISEPPKANRQMSIEKSETLRKTTCLKTSSFSKNSLGPKEKGVKGKNSDFNDSERRTESPIYINLKKKERKNMNDNNHIRNKQSLMEQQKNKKEFPKTKDDLSNTKHNNTKSNYCLENFNNNIVEKPSDTDKQNAEENNSGKKKNCVRRTKVLVTPEKSPVINQPSVSKCREISSKKLAEKGSSKEKKNIILPIQSHRSLKAESRDCVKASQSYHDSKQSKVTLAETERKAPETQKELDQLSIETTSKQKSTEIVHANDAMRDIILSQPNKPAKIDKIQNKSRRSKYVINYDDKNGTVSSICKIKPDHGATKKIKNINYNTKENFKSNSLKNTKNKIDLQQHPDQQWILCGNYMTKSKIRAKKYCDIL